MGAVLHQNQRPLLALDAPLFELSSEKPGVIVEFMIGQGPKVGLASAPGVGLKQMRLKVERLGRWFNRACGCLISVSLAPPHARARLASSELAMCGHQCPRRTAVVRVRIMQYCASFIFRRMPESCPTMRHSH